MKNILLTALLLGALSVAILRFRQPELAALRREIAQARGQQSDIEALRKQLRAGSSDTADPKELERLRALRPELARLRGNILVLRQRAGKTPTSLQSEAGKIHDEAAQIHFQREAKKASLEANNLLGVCLGFVFDAAYMTDGTLPQTWDEVRSRLTHAPTNTVSVLLDYYKQATVMRDELSRFEIVPDRAHLRLKDGEALPHLPLIREINPRPQPDGGWARCYGWTDRDGREIVLPDGNFAAWEADHFTFSAGLSPGR